MIREMQEKSRHLIQYVDALDDSEREFFVKNVCFIQKDIAYVDAQNIINKYLHQSTFLALWKEDSERFERYKKTSDIDWKL
jgi:hypothetical protein